jgi:hypothetical protein
MYALEVNQVITDDEELMCINCTTKKKIYKKIIIRDIKKINK